MGINNGGYTVSFNLTPAEFKHIEALVNYSEVDAITKVLSERMDFNRDRYKAATDEMYEAVKAAKEQKQYFERERDND